MKFIIFFEGVFFSAFYSLAPFLVFDGLYKPAFGFLNYEPVQQKELRYWIVCAMSFFAFYFYSELGWRTRYVIWHLEKRRYASGFNPLETLLVVFYHSVFLSLGADTFLLLWNPYGNPVKNITWNLLLPRVQTVALYSIVQHTSLELSGFFDRQRRNYFDIER